MAYIIESKVTFQCPICLVTLHISMHASTQDRFVFSNRHNKNCNNNYRRFLYTMDENHNRPHNQSDESFIKFVLDHYEQNKNLYALEEF